MDSRQEPSDDKISLLLTIARRAAQRWCRCASDADDIAQEAVLRLLAQDIFPVNFHGWLFVVTRRIAGRQREREQRRAHAESAYASGAVSVSDPELLVDIRHVLAAIGERDSAVLMRVIEGADSKEIAAEFGCRTRDVGQLVSRARQKARRTAKRNPVRKRPRRGS